ncbi:hypothetical protein P7C70_g4095, partial [Phenoliferia sp. Uapishka_3]
MEQDISDAQPSPFETQPSANSTLETAPTVAIAIPPPEADSSPKSRPTYLLQIPSPPVYRPPSPLVQLSLSQNLDPNADASGDTDDDSAPLSLFDMGTGFKSSFKTKTELYASIVASSCKQARGGAELDDEELRVGFARDRDAGDEVDSEVDDIEGESPMEGVEEEETANGPSRGPAELPFDFVPPPAAFPTLSSQVEPFQAEDEAMAVGRESLPQESLEEPFVPMEVEQASATEGVG